MTDLVTGLRVSNVSAASPDMSDEAYRELVEDIRKHGQLVPIWISNGEVIDGRKRLRACGELGIDPKVIDLSDGQDPAALSYSLNILRTHYTAGQRAMFASKRATLTRSGSGKRRHSASSNYHMLGVSSGEAATEAGVERNSVAIAKRIRREGAPAVVAAVEAGRLTLHSARQIVKAVARENQPEAVAQVIEASKGKARNTPVQKAIGRQRNGFHRSPTRPLQWRVERGLDQLDNAVECLGRFLAERGADKHPEYPKWIRQVAAAKSGLVKIIKGESQ